LLTEKQLKSTIVNHDKHKLIIGILGGIGSGKSTVAAEFVKLGCKAINADAIAHELLKEPQVRAKITDAFGDDILAPDGEIDRHKLANIAFSNAGMLEKLNGIVHPEVLNRCESLIIQYNDQIGINAIVLDMPLLVEVGWAEKCDKLVFVSCDWQNRLERVKRKGVVDENKLKIRENFQISPDTKTNISDIVIDNNSGLLELSQRVAEIFADMSCSC